MLLAYHMSILATFIGIVLGAFLGTLLATYAQRRWHKRNEHHEPEGS